MLTEATHYLRTYFGYDTFREGQQHVIANVLNGHDTLVVMPTGGGKSLCYQIPALCLHGTTIVISPLISLMKDQVDMLNASGISAAFINSSLSYSEVDDVLAAVMAGQVKLLYIAPERLANAHFCQQLARVHVPLIAIDEAHCISQWGHDFRPSYRDITKLQSLWTHKPTIIALTATATVEVADDIRALLQISAAYTFVTGFARHNLQFRVLVGERKDPYIRRYVMANRNEAGIIYCATRKAVEAVYALLVKEGVPVGKYHGGLDEQTRTNEQQAFLNDETKVMVATNAFGMGINKTNVRYVIHYQMPRNMESYYQEAGRAGRDGLPSECVLLYASADEQTQRYLIDQTQDRSRISFEIAKLQQMVDYCHTEQCLQQYIVHYFGDLTAQSCARCGNCVDERPKVNVTTEAQKVLSCVIRMGQRWGKAMTALVLAGSKSEKVLEQRFHELPTYGLLKQMNSKEIGQLIEFLIAERLLGITNHQFPTLFVEEMGKQVLLGQREVWRKTAVVIQQAATDDPLFDVLRQIRKELATAQGVPPFVVFSDKTLRHMCELRPTTETQFLQVHGVGEQKFDKYGMPFLQAIRAFCEQHEGE